MFNEEKVADQELKIHGLHNDIDKLVAVQIKQRAELDLSNGKLKELTVKHDALQGLVKRYVDVREDYFARGMLGVDCAFKIQVERLEMEKAERAERAKIEAIVRDLLKKNVFKDVKE